MAAPVMTPELSEANELRKLLDEVTQRTVDSYVREKELGSAMSFAEARQLFDQVLQFCRTLSASKLEQLPLILLNEMRSQFGNVRDGLQQIASFQIQNQSNPLEIRNVLIQNLRQYYSAFFVKAVPGLALLEAQKGQTAEQSAQQSAALKELLEIVGRARDSETQLKGTIEAVKQAAQQAGVARHTIHFKNEADEHAAAARNWLKATSWMGSSTVVIALAISILSIVFRTNFSSSELIQIGLGKFVLFSVLITATLWCGKTYKAHRHNYVVNKHRQNALSTFESFVAAAEGDPQTKSAVLLQATTCIFSPQNTGYFDTDEAKSAPTQVMEIFRGVTDKS